MYSATSSVLQSRCGGNVVVRVTATYRRRRASLMVLVRRSLKSYTSAMNMRQPVGKFRAAPRREARWAQLRDGLMVQVPVRATFTPDDPAWPTVEVEVDENSGSLVATKVSLTATAQHPIQSNALRTYSLQKLCAIAAKQVAVPAVGWKGYERGEAWPPSNRAVMESIVTATRSRTSVDRERLADVARLHRQGRVTAVESGLNVSRSQAYRLIKLAREANLIEED